jgi:16S rRNA (guanine966-N2)-methyltransferase
MRRQQPQNKQKPTQGFIRLIAGKHRGRKLPVLTAAGLRPTTDRVKETVFNWLMFQLQDARCLDCFAGSGSLGFEAISRGAAWVQLIEKNTAAAKQLTKNLAALSVEHAAVYSGDCLHFLTHQQPQPFDIVFIDPPFRQQLVPQVCQLLSQGWLADHAFIYIEIEKEASIHFIPANWQLLKQKVAGQVAYRLYQQVTSSK